MKWRRNDRNGGKPLVLVAAPQRAVRLLAAAALRPAGFRVAHSAGSLPTPDELADLRPDVIVLEVDDQPGRAASTVRDVADWSRAPILLVSSHATSSQVAAVLDAGADDHLARPFDPAEFIARVRALVRRQGGGINAGTVAVGRSLVDLERRTVSRAGTLRELTRAEWALLTTLIRKRGAIVLREELLAAAFGEAAHDDPALLRVLVSRLRRKLGCDPWDEGMIRTVHGIGYAFDPDQELPRPAQTRPRPSSIRRELEPPALEPSLPPGSLAIE